MNGSTRKILIIIVIINLLILLAGGIYFLTKGKLETAIETNKLNDTIATNEPNLCYSAKLTNKQNPYIKAKLAQAIVEDEDKKYTTKQTYNYITNKSLNFVDLKKYSYGFQIKNSPSAYYIDYEICDLATNKTLTYPKLFKNIYYKRDTQFAGTEWEDGEQTNFAWVSITGETKYPMEKPGKYAIDVYASSKDGDWEWVDRLEFEVK